MWFNGFMVVIDMALAKLDAPLLHQHREALILGAFREDVCFVPGAQLVVQSPSLTHFYRRGVPGGFVPFLWPGPAQRSCKFMRRAVCEFEHGREASAFVQLGRAAHPLIDMSCPVHAQGVAHSTDPFEWCVEAMDRELRRLSAEEVERPRNVPDIVEGMALFSQGFTADRTNNPWGRLMRRLGRRRPVHAALAREQALALIPRAAGYTASLFALFLDKAGGGEARLACEESLSETLRHLEMSPAGIRTWLSHLERFVHRHGGARHYGELMDLITNCRARLDPQVARWTH